MQKRKAARVDCTFKYARHIPSTRHERSKEDYKCDRQGHPILFLSLALSVFHFISQRWAPVQLINVNVSTISRLGERLPFAGEFTCPVRLLDTTTSTNLSSLCIDTSSPSSAAGLVSVVSYDGFSTS